MKIHRDNIFFIMGFLGGIFVAGIHGLPGILCSVLVGRTRDDDGDL